MQKVVSNSFAITASKDAVSFDHQDNYSLIEASGNMPSATDSRWQFIPVGGQALKPTSAAPYLWHKVITFLTDGSHLDPVISFGGSMGQNGIDYDLVPSVSSILKAENNTLTPANVTCAMIKRNADGSAQNLSSIPSGYTIKCYRDATASNYSLGQQISTSGVTVISFVLQYNGTDIERHDIRVITEGSQGIDGRGIQSQDYRFKATDTDTAPNTPTNETQWNTWLSLQGSNYSELLPYLWKCIKTTYVDGNGKIDIEYHVEGPTVWGQSPTHVVTVYGCSQSSAEGANYPETGGPNPCKQKFYFDKTLLSAVQSRGLVLEVIDPRTGERKLTSGNFFDTYGSTEAAGKAKATELANLIYNYLDTDYLICLASYDACAINADLINMLRNFGLGREMVSFSRARKAFAFVGQSGMDYGQASYKFIPNNGEIAMVKATVTDGQLVPSMVHQSLFDVDIDNEMTSVPVSYNASGNGSTQSQITRSFGLSAFMGATNVISDCQVSVVGTLPTGITANVSNKSNPSVTIANGTALPPTTEITFRVTYADLEARDVVFTIAAVMPGRNGDSSTIYELLPSETSINIGRTASGGYNPAKFSLTCGYVKNVGTQAPVVVTNPTDSFDGYNIYYRLCSRSTKAWGSYSLYSKANNGTLLSNLDVAAYCKVEFIICKNTAATVAVAAVTGLIDRETVPVVVDGEKGADGSSPFVVDLNNEMSSVLLKSDGKPLSDYSITLRLAAFYGSTDVTDDATVEVSCDNATINGNINTYVDTSNFGSKQIVINIPNTVVLTEKTDFTFTVKHSTYSPDGTPVVFTLAGVKSSVFYELLPTLSQIVFNRDANGNLTSSQSSLSCNIKEVDVSGSTVLTSVPSGYTLKCRADSMPTATQTTGLLSNTVSIDANVVGAFNCICYALFDSNGNIVDRETIPVVKDGEKGNEGRGIESQTTRYISQAENEYSVPSTPTSTSAFNSNWYTLAGASYSESRPYLWKCTQTKYKNGTPQYQWIVEGPMVWGKSGESSFIVDLDNEMTSIPVSSGAGKVESAVTIGFSWKGFYGQTDVTDDCTITPDPNGNWPSGFTCDTSSKTTPQVTIAANTVPANVTELEFKITHPSYGDRYAKFTVAAIKSGGVGQNAILYELMPSITEIAVGRTASGGYTPNPLTYAITCGYVKYDGQTVAGSSTDLTGSIDGYSIYFRMRQRSNNTWSNYFKYSTYKATHLAANKFNVLSYNKLEFILCKNSGNTISSELSISSLIDRESIPVVADGVNGTSPYTVDLDNEMGAVACDADGKVTVGTTFTLRVSAWHGTTDVTAALTFDEIGVGNNGIAINNSIATDHNLTVTVPAGITLDDVTEIQIPVKHSSYEPDGRTLIFTLAAVRPGGPGEKAVLRELLPSLSQISFARVSGSNALTPASRTLTVTIRRTEGGVSTEQTISAANAVVRWSLSSMPANKTAGSDISTSACTVPSSTTATCVYLAAFDKTSGAVLDKETIPILKDGEIGGSGNGIDTVTFARMFTMGFEAPSNTDSGWILDTSANYPTESGLSETNLYLWQRKKTTYTESDDVTYEVSLINQFQSGIRANLLEDTAFLDDNEMDAWETHVGSVIKNTSTNLPQNGWQNGSERTQAYIDFLVQKIWDGTNVKKVQPNKWYTLSFYAAQEPLLHLFSGSAYNNNATGVITGAMSQFYLASGQSATVYVTGRITNASVSYMRVYVWTTDGVNWVQNEHVDIRTVSNTTVSVTITNQQSDGRVFNVCPYMYDNSGNLITSTATTYRGYCTKIDVDRGHCLNTYISRGNWSVDAIQHGTGSVIYVDGVKITGPTTLADGTSVRFDSACTIVWKLSATPKRHTVTFKTAAWGSTTDAIHVRFRHGSYSHYGWVCMPKLEENTIATEWIENSADRYASDFQHIYVGDWKASTNGQAATYYLYALGVRHVVRAKKSATENDMTYFRLKKRTPNTGYCSTQQPYADTTHWEEASYLKFVAADLILSEEVITDKLTVSKVRSKNGTFVIDENGNVIANGGNFSNVRVSAGSANGARVEITPGSASDGGGKMAIYNSSGNVVAQYSGETVSNPVNLYGNSTDNATVQINNMSVNVANYDCPDFMWKTQSQSRTFNLTKQMVLSFPATTMYVEVQPADNIVDPKEDCLFRVSLYLNGNLLYTYNDMAERGERRSFTLNLPSRSVIGIAGQNVLTLELSLYDKDYSDKSGSFAEASAVLIGFNITASIEKQMSYHFANGLAIGMSSTQYFITYGISAGMVHEMRSGTFGLRVHPTAGIQKWNGSQWVTANL